MINKKRASRSVWNITQKQFPSNGNLNSKIKFLVRYAILAPSGHNSQPWKFKIEDTILHILPDFSRKRPEVDPNDRELFISLGCAGKNIEIAASNFGMIYDKKIVKDKIIFNFKEGKTKSANQELLKAITNRRTYRGEFIEKTVDKEILDNLITGNKTAWVEMFYQKQQRQRLANLIYEADLVWFKSKELVEEMEGWLRDDIEHSKDGLPTGVLNLYKLATEIKYLFIKDNDEALKRAKRDKESVLKSPLLAVIASKTDNIEGWIMAGEIYQLLALKLTDMGLANGFYNTVVELNGQRRKLSSMLGIKGKVQLLLRIGYAANLVVPSPRRELKEVIV